MEVRAGFEAATVEVEGPKNERPGPVAQSTGAGLEREVLFRLEDSSVGAIRSDIAGLDPRAAGNASQLTEDHAECAAQDVGGLIRRKVERIDGAEMEAERPDGKTCSFSHKLDCNCRSSTLRYP